MLRWKDLGELNSPALQIGALGNFWPVHEGVWTVSQFFHCRLLELFVVSVLSVLILIYSHLLLAFQRFLHEFSARSLRLIHFCVGSGKSFIPQSPLEQETGKRGHFQSNNSAQIRRKKNIAPTLKKKKPFSRFWYFYTYFNVVNWGFNWIIKRLIIEIVTVFEAFSSLALVRRAS